MTGEADNPMTGCDFDWMVSNHAVWGWKAPVKASVSGVCLIQLSPFFASIFPLFPQKRLILRLLERKGMGVLVLALRARFDRVLVDFRKEKENNVGYRLGKLHEKLFGN